MIALNYSKYDVLAIFRQQNPTATNPSASQIQQLDSDLFDANDDSLTTIMTDENLPTTKSVKSTILLYSRVGAGTLNQRIRSACRYYKNTQPI